ncbi:Vgb family protein [Paraliomyxa miuraensis]|uniref:Vgb family protein n=1 Tax=Paraliomyxa miuraensis TaxID=376150 RepID=UPI002253B250|nr:PEP-CTERM sorting domain-containing protein [Paraliomyxa miuraensis]MCX4241176.1 PEP-CTERM sorting domain-containing protein [Paraliomyxa miuraensis]
MNGTLRHVGLLALSSLSLLLVACPEPEAEDTSSGSETTDGDTTAAPTDSGSTGSTGSSSDSSTSTVDSSSTGEDTTTGTVEPRSWVLVGNTRGDDVIRIDAETGLIDGTMVAAGTGGLYHPDTLLIRDGMLYVASGDTPETSAILRFDATTGDLVDTFIMGGGLHRPYGFAFGGDGMIYVASFLTDELLRYDDTTGDFVDVFASGDGMPGGLNGPNDVKLGPDGALYVSTQGSVAMDGMPTFPGLPSEVLRFDLGTGQSTVHVQQPTPLPDSLGFVSMLGVAFGPDCDGGACDLYTTDFAGGLRRHDAMGAVVWEVSTSYVMGAATGALAFGSDGEIYVPAFDTADDTGPGVLLRFDAATGDPLPGDGLSGAIFVGPDSALVRPIGVAFVVEPQ